MPSRTEVKHEYADFISQFRWDVYSTITFRHKRTDAMYWSERVWQFLEKFNSTRAFIAVEPHYYEGIHLHILSRHIPSLQNLGSIWKYSFKAFGRSTIEYVDNTLAISRYCAKYVVKGNQFDFKGDAGWWNISENSEKLLDK